MNAVQPEIICRYLEKQRLDSAGDCVICPVGNSLFALSRSGFSAKIAPGPFNVEPYSGDHIVCRLVQETRRHLHYNSHNTATLA